MGFWAIALVIFGGALAAGLAAPRGSKSDQPPEQLPSDEQALWTPDALARLGTPGTVADLIAQGRGVELRGIGYEGELPRDD
jgi:hypothetical protein